MHITLGPSLCFNDVPVITCVLPDLHFLAFFKLQLPGIACVRATFSLADGPSKETRLFRLPCYVLHAIVLDCVGSLDGI